ncbi:MAG: hypothetical protein AAGB03_00095 [Pseudomonadota bacterium]
MRFLSAVVLTLFLVLTFQTFTVKHHARQANEALRNVEAEIADHKKSLTLLKAEWGLIDRADFLEARVAEFDMVLRVPDAQRVLAMGDVIALLEDRPPLDTRPEGPVERQPAGLAGLPVAQSADSVDRGSEGVGLAQSGEGLRFAHAGGQGLGR